MIHLEVTLFGWRDVKIEELTNQNVGECSVGFMDRFSWMLSSISQTMLLPLYGVGGGGGSCICCINIWGVSLLQLVHVCCYDSYEAFVACYRKLTMKLMALWSCVRTQFWDLCNVVCVCLCVVCRLRTQIQPQADVSARLFSLSQCRLLRYFYACCTTVVCCWQALVSCFLQ